MRSESTSNFVAYSLVAATIASGFVFVGSALTGLLLFVWMGLGLRQIARTRTWNYHPLSLWMLAYLAWLIVTVWLSTIPGASWLAGWVAVGLPITYLAWGMTPNPEKVWGMLRTTLLLAGPAFALWGLGQVVTGVGRGQPVGPLIDKNAFAALMNVFWFMACVHLIGKVPDRGLNLRMVLPTLGLLLIAMALFAAESRGATLSWLLLMPFVLWAGYKGTRNKVAIFVILAIALTGYLSASNWLGLNVAHRTLNLEQDASTSARLMMWKSTAQIALDHPITGTGLGTFASHYPAYRDIRENSSAGMLAHNDYIQLAAEGGIPSLVLLLGILVGLLLQLKRSLALKPSPHTLEATGLLLSLLALFIQANLNFIFNFAFMNILAGLFAARAIQLTHPDGINKVKLDGLAQIGRSTKTMVAGFMALLLAGPLLLHLLAQSTLSGSQPGLALLRAAWPTLNAYGMANFITALRPSSGIAQHFLLDFSENVLVNSGGIRMEGGNLQRELLYETLGRYELRRSQTNNNPAYGVREARVLIRYQGLLEPGSALRRAREILTQNLRIDPFHADSMIELSRLDVIEGRPQQAQQLLGVSMRHVLSRRDQQLLAVEILRQRASPGKITELDSIEKKLREMRADSEVGKVLILPENFNENIEVRLAEIARTLGQ